MQTRRLSAVEALTNTAVGFGVSCALTLLVLPVFGLHPSLPDSLGISAVFTAASILRGYALRRVFVRVQERVQ